MFTTNSSLKKICQQMNAGEMGESWPPDETGQEQCSSKILKLW